ncbi:MAG: hypothetical protein WC365_05810 [Candidatus Babeliales bacterium]|jgi:hypothetical protein
MEDVDQIAAMLTSAVVQKTTFCEFKEPLKTEEIVMAAVSIFRDIKRQLSNK